MTGKTPPTSAGRGSGPATPTISRVDATGESRPAQRSATRGNTGRYITQNLNLTNTVVQADSSSSAATGEATPGVLARYADTVTGFKRGPVLGRPRASTTLDVEKRVAATITTLRTVEVTGLPDTVGATLRLMVLGVRGVGRSGSGRRAAICAGSRRGRTRRSLPAGLWRPATPASTTSTQTRPRAPAATTTIAAWVPPADAVIFSSQSVETPHRRGCSARIPPAPRTGRCRTWSATCPGCRRRRSRRAPASSSSTHPAAISTSCPTGPAPTTSRCGRSTGPSWLTVPG